MADSPVNVEPQITVDRYYTIIRGQVEHEDNLISQRLSWFITAQSFLFTAYAITISNIDNVHSPAISQKMRLLLVLIPLASMLSCVLIYVTIIAGLIAIADLRRLYKSFTGTAPTHLPPVQGYRRTQVMGLAAPMGVPLVFLAVWLLLLVHGLK
jgi:hypothetical protein